MAGPSLLKTVHHWNRYNLKCTPKGRHKTNSMLGTGSFLGLGTNSSEGANIDATVTLCNDGTYCCSDDTTTWDQLSGTECCARGIGTRLENGVAKSSSAILSSSSASTFSSPPIPHNMNTGAIAGGTVGGIAGSVLVSLVLWYHRFRKRRPRNRFINITEMDHYAGGQWVQMGELDPQGIRAEMARSPNLRAELESRGQRSVAR